MTANVRECHLSKENYFCFHTGSCVSSLAECQWLTSGSNECPAGTSYNYESNSCMQALPVDGSVVICTEPNQFYCSATGECTDAPCPEWVSCPDGLIQCATGQCVIDSATCPISTNWCPFYKPIMCPYSTLCVATLNECQITAEDELNTYC